MMSKNPGLLNFGFGRGLQPGSPPVGCTPVTVSHPISYTHTVRPT